MSRNTLLVFMKSSKDVNTRAGWLKVSEALPFTGLSDRTFRRMLDGDVIRTQHIGVTRVWYEDIPVPAPPPKRKRRR